MTLEEWDAQFTRQAGWTRGTRTHLYRRANLLRAARVLDVGSGTGVVTEELAARTQGEVVGVDLDPEMVAFARRRGGRADYRGGDAHALSFREGWFDVVACHFVLMWCRDPAQVAREMVRVTRPGGSVLVCAEPDYGGRIDHPPELVVLGQRQTDALREQGADPEIGRRLGEIFSAAGLRAMVGTMAGQWRVPAKPGDAPDDEFEAEWAMRERDLNGILPPEELRRLRAIDRQALEEGHRILFVPTFYALGYKVD